MRLDCGYIRPSSHTQPHRSFTLATLNEIIPPPHIHNCYESRLQNCKDSNIVWLYWNIPQYFIFSSIPLSSEIKKKMHPLWFCCLFCPRGISTPYVAWWGWYWLQQQFTIWYYRVIWSVNEILDVLLVNTFTFKRKLSERIGNISHWNIFDKYLLLIFFNLNKQTNKWIVIASKTDILLSISIMTHLVKYFDCPELR